MSILLVTGSGTGAGKTITAAAIAACAIAAGRSVAVVKPVQTGVASDEPADIDDVRRLSGAEDVHEYARFTEPLAPATAARRMGQAGPSIDGMVELIISLADRDLVIVEGAGGALVQFNEQGHTILDLGIALTGQLTAQEPPRLLLATSCALGTLHATAATAQVVRAAGLAVDHLVITDWPTSGIELANRCNLEDLPIYAQAPLDGVLANGLGLLSQVDFGDSALDMLAPRLGGTLDTTQFTRLNAHA
ncbi:MAG: dethiobiotin synthase [Candidatus Nanopelagicales bacterium]